MDENILASLRNACERAYRLPFYKKRWDQIEFQPGLIKTVEDFQKLPFTTREDQWISFQEEGFLGSLFHENTVHITHTPAPGGLLPEFHSLHDLRSNANAIIKRLRALGITEKDVVQITTSYAPVAAGLVFHLPFMMMGCKTINSGPGETQRQVEIMKRLKSTVLVAFPSFATQIANAGGTSFEKVILVGEPFSSIPGYRERMRKLFQNESVILADGYGTSGFSLISLECSYEKGPHIMDDYVFAEVIDPETGDVLPDGEKGELVLTHLDKESMPLIRFRTGDLTKMERIGCPCGASLTLTNGVFGRTTEMRRVKGLKFYPSQVGFVLSGFPVLNPRRYQIVIERSEGKTDRISLKVQGNPENIDLKQLSAALKNEFIFKFDDIYITPDLPDAPMVEDRRGGVDRD